MITRYTSPEMGRIWSDQRRYETWLQVEMAAVEAMARAGIVPADAARDIREKGAFDIDRIEAIERVTQHDVIAFTTSVAEAVGPSARWLHFGLTSSDVIDTAQALQMREACGVVLDGMVGADGRGRVRADEHRRTAMIGRTHGVHAEPMTFGVKLALWHAELARGVERLRRARDVVSVGKLSGAVGTFAHLPPPIEADVCRRSVSSPPPVASQVIQRDRHAELLTAIAITGSSLEKFALEVRGLQKTEIGEVEEPFAKGQKGSSAMPHKRNPDRLRADRRSGAAAARQRACGAREQRPLARARHLALVGGARHPARQLHRARPHAAPLHPRGERDGGVSRSHAQESRAVARRGVLGHGAARAGPARRLARAGLRVGAAQRDARVSRAARVQVAAAEPTPRLRRRCRPRRSSAPSISTIS